MKTLFHNKVFSSWMLSYLVILAIPIVTGMLIYNQAIGIIKNEVSKVHQSSMEETKAYVDNRLEMVQNIRMQIVLDQKNRFFLQSHAPVPPSDMYFVSDIQTNLIKYMTQTDSISDILIYYKNAQFILTPTNLYEKSDFDTCIQQKFGMSFLQIMKLEKNSKFNDFRIIRSSGDTGKKIITMQSLGSSKSSEPDAVVFIALNEQKICSDVEKVSASVNETVVLSNGYNEFLSTKPIKCLPDFLQFSNISQHDGIFYNLFQNEDSAVAYTTSNITGWKYISITPSKTYLQNVQFIKIIMIIYIFGCLILGLLMAYYWTKKNYKSINKLTQILQKDAGKASCTDKNEYLFLEKSLLNLIEEKESFKSTVAKQSYVVLNDYLAAILRGRIQKIASVKTFLKNYNIEFVSNQFLVAVFTVDDYGKEFSVNEIEKKSEVFETVDFIIKNVTEELVNQRNFGIIVEVSGVLACVVNLKAKDKNPNRAVDEVSEAFSSAQNFIYKSFGIKLSIAVSDIHYSVTQLNKAYSEAMEAMEYLTVLGKKFALIHYCEIKISKPTDFMNCLTKNEQEERKLLNCAVAGDYQGAKEVLDDIFSDDLYQSANSLKLAQCRMLGLINSLLHVSEEVKCSVDISFFNQVDPVSKLMGAKSIVELQRCVEEIYELFSEYYKNKRNTLYLPDKADEITEYIEKHYTDPNLGIKEISSCFQISDSYVSRILKKKLGIGLNDYIHTLRIQKAKNLMNTTKMSIKEIAEQVGYPSSLAMNRAFKKYEGVPPTEYRKIERTS